MADHQQQMEEAQKHLNWCYAVIAGKREQGYLAEEAMELHHQASRELEAQHPLKAERLISEARRIMRDPMPDPEFTFREPSSWAEILAELPSEGKKLTKDYYLTDYEDKVQGGWLGKNIGGALGGPVEGWKRADILAKYGEVWDYIKPPGTINDDTAYQIVALHSLLKYGLDITSDQLAVEWVELLPGACTAEEVAIQNLKRGIYPPESGIENNPFSEWIGAQMKGEIWGFIAPGQPDIAAQYAYLDGIIAHEKNGVYGEIYDAALISAAFVENNPRELLHIGLSYIPKNCRLRKVVLDTLEICDSSKNWQEAADKVDTSWIAPYNLTHTFPNLSNMIIGLIFGENDFEKTICITNMCGLDTDCTAGQAGAILGVISGASQIPAKWKDPIGDQFDTYVIGWEHLETSKITETTCDIGQRILEKFDR